MQARVPPHSSPYPNRAMHPILRVVRPERSSDTSPAARCHLCAPDSGCCLDPDAHPYDALSDGNESLTPTMSSQAPSAGSPNPSVAASAAATASDTDRKAASPAPAPASPAAAAADEKPYDPEDEFRAMFMSKDEFEAEQRQRAAQGLAPLPTPGSSAPAASAAADAASAAAPPAQGGAGGGGLTTAPDGQLHSLSATDGRTGQSVSVGTNPSLQQLLQKALQQANLHAHGGAGDAAATSDDVLDVVTPGAAATAAAAATDAEKKEPSVQAVEGVASASNNNNNGNAGGATADAARAEPEAEYSGPDKAYRNKEAPAFDDKRRNSKRILCPFCKKSVIFLKGAAEYVERDIFLPYANAASSTHGQVYTEHFRVTSQMSFENIGVRQSKEGDPFRYLTCSDCDRGPVGITFHADKGKIFYVAHRRVRYQ